MEIKRIIKILDREPYYDTVWSNFDQEMCQWVEVEYEDGTTGEEEMWYPEYPTGEDEDGEYHLIDGEKYHDMSEWDLCFDSSKLVYRPYNALYLEIYSTETLEKIGEEILEPSF